MTNDLEKLVDRHPGKEFVVLGTGPSLATFDLRFCNNRVSIGVNGIGQLYFPDYYLILDPLAYSLFQGVFDSAPSSRIVGPWFECATCHYRVRPEKDHLIGLEKRRLFHAQTVGYVAVNLAYTMGASKIFMVGIDGYGLGGPLHFYSDTPELRTKIEADWSLERQMLVKEAFRFAAAQLAAEEILLYNLSATSFLKEVVPTIAPTDVSSAGVC